MIRSLAPLLLLLFLVPEARASDPLAVYTYPARVDLLPGESDATHVVIHGAFFFRKADGSYGSPACGYMYFQCPPDKLAMCRMQWQEVRNGIGKTYCTAFGALQMTTSATLRAEGTPRGAPDTWDLGIGVGLGVHVDGKCEPAQKLGCKAPSLDGGTTPADMAAPAADGPPPSVDLAQEAPKKSGCAVGGRAQPPALLFIALAGVLGALLRRRKRWL